MNVAKRLCPFFLSLLFFLILPFIHNQVFADTGWHLVSNPNDNANGSSSSREIFSSSAVSANDIWSVGFTLDFNTSNFSGLIMHWDGTHWTTVSNPANHVILYGVSAISANDVWAVGLNNNHTLTMHWDGTSWTIVSSPNPGTFVNALQSVTAVSSNDVWAVGFTSNQSSNDSQPLTMHWDGSSWTTVTTPSPCLPSCQNYLNTVTASSPNDVWAVGLGNNNADTLTERWDGSTWTIVSSPNPSSTFGNWLLAAKAISSNDVWAVGTDGQPLTMHWDGTSWTTVATQNPTATPDNFFESISAVSSNDIWAVGIGDNGFTEHWDGSSWNLVTNPISSSNLYSVVATASNNVWAMGNTPSGILTEHYPSTAKTPLIFIPGIMGSKLAVTGSQSINPISKQINLNPLDPNSSCVNAPDIPILSYWSYNQGDLLWIDENPLDFLSKVYQEDSVPCSNYLDLLQFNSSGQPVYSQVGLSGDIMNRTYNDGTINTAIPYLMQQGYTPGVDFFVFPYDWRKDIDNDMAALDALVDNATSIAGTSKVDMLTHSMGGLVARDYISNSTQASKVHTLVETAPPHVGAPKLLAQVLYNTCPVTVLFNLICVINGQEANKLVQNMPGAFELLPSRKYYDLYPNLYPYNDTQFYNSMLGPLSYSNLRTLLISSDPKFNKNVTVFDIADNFHGTTTHSGLDDSYAMPPNGVNIFTIAGSGTPTFGQLYDYISSNSGEIKQDAIATNGDGTVPLLSATLGLTNNVYYTNQDHGNIITGAGLAMAVNLLNGNTNTVSGVQTTPFNFSGTILSVHSPTLLDAYDNLGNHTGSSSAGFIEEGIPGSTYDQLGSSKFIYLPAGGTYHLSTRPISAGTFDLKLTTYSNNTPTQELVYKNVPQTAQTTSSMSLTNNNTTLSLDVNGDGTNIQSVSPTYNLTGSAASDYAPPFTAATLTPTPRADGTFSSPVTITLSSSASAGFSVAHTYYTLDGGSQQTYSAPFTVSNAGNHTLTYWSVDNEGLIEATNSKTFTVVQTTIAQDTFQRSNQSHWGTASDGHTWGSDASSNSTFSINTNKGIQSSGGSTTYSATLGASATDAQVLFSGSMTSFTNSNIGAILRFTDGNNWYKAYIDGANLVMQKKVNGTTTTLRTMPFSAAANTNYSLRFQAVGTTLSAKVWQTSGTEPADWMASVTDNAFSSGYCGLRVLTQTGITASYTSFIATPATTPTPTLLYQDTFQRANQSHWGTASDGHTWGSDASSNNTFSISSNKGVQSSGNGTSYSATLGTTVTNAQVLFTGSMSSFSNANLGAILRFTDGNNWYKAYIEGSNLVIQKKVDGTTTALSTVSFTATANTNYSLRFQVLGSTLSAKVWLASSTEPTSWMTSVTDTSFTSGYTGLRVLTQSGITAAYTSFSAYQL